MEVTAEPIWLESYRDRNLGGLGTSIRTKTYTMANISNPYEGSISYEQFELD